MEDNREGEGEIGEEREERRSEGRSEIGQGEDKLFMIFIILLFWFPCHIFILNNFFEIYNKQWHHGYHSFESK